jgi:hypothetical protein
LGPLPELRLTCMFDAALGVRHNGSSQGGYIILSSTGCPIYNKY